MKTSHQALVCAAVAVLSWSTVATAFKLALQQLTYFELIVIASLTALLLFGLTLTVRHQWPLVARLSRRQWGRFAFLGLLNPVCYYLVLFRSYELLPAQVAQPVNYAWPIVLLLLLALFGHRPIPRSKYGGMAVSLAGVALISAGTGGTSGLSIGHISPEAASGGNIGKIKDGDIIVIDIPSRSINVRLSDEELAARPQQPLRRKREVSKALRAYAQSVASADRGGVRIIED